MRSSEAPGLVEGGFYLFQTLTGGGRQCIAWKTWAWPTFPWAIGSEVSAVGAVVRTWQHPTWVRQSVVCATWVPGNAACGWLIGVRLKAHGPWSFVRVVTVQL